MHARVCGLGSIDDVRSGPHEHYNIRMRDVAFLIGAWSVLDGSQCSQGPSSPRSMLLARAA